MTRPTLQTGNIWSDVLANAAGYPRLDGADEYGSGEKVIDDWLNDAPDQIKARFYGWRNRIAVTVSTGRTIAFTGATILLTNGSQVALSAGTLTLPANSTRYVFVTDAGAISHATSLPAECIPLALAVTDGAAVTSLVDIRYQVAEHVRRVSSDGESSTFDIGDIKESARITPSTGWVVCNNAIYNDADYPLAAAAIGRQFSLPGDAVGTFRVPGIQDRTVIGSSVSRPTGTLLGSEAVSLNVANLARHGHNVTESAHTHGATDSGHGHGTSDPGHGHPIWASYDTSGGNTDSLIVEDAAVAGEQSGTKGYTTETNNNTGPRIILPQTTGLSVNSGRANVTISAARTNLSIANTGEGQPFSVMQPSISLNKFIRLF
jgi:microcystin-dependent protein